MREADAEHEAAARRGLGAEGLLRQHHRVTRVAGDHRRAELDVGHLAAGDGDGGQGVMGEDLGQPGGGEAVIGDLPHRCDHLVDRAPRHRVPQEDADAHGRFLSDNGFSVGSV